MYISFKSRIILVFIALYTILTLVLSMVYRYQFDVSTVSQIRDSDLKTTQTVSTALNQLFISVEEIGGLIKQDPEVVALLKHANTIPIGNKKLYASFDLKEFPSAIVSSIALLSADGYLICPNNTSKERMDLIFGPSTVKILSKTAPTWLDMFNLQDLESEEVYPVLPCTVPILDSENNFLGHLVLFLRENKIAELLRAYDSNVFISDDENRIISFSDKSYLYKDFYHRTKVMYLSLDKDVSTVYQPTPSDNPVVLTTQYYPKMSWKIVVMSDPNILYAHKKVGLSLTVNVVIICAITLSLIAVLLIIYISRPIARLRQDMKTAATGDFSLRSSYDKNDEFGELSKIFNQLLHKVQDLMEQVKQQEKQKQNYRFQLIQSQINPHFLYNVFELINSFVRLDMKDSALLAIKNVSGFYRISLSDGVNIITVKDEVQLLRQYLTLMEMRYCEFMKFTIEVSEEVYPYAIPKLTLQPLAENAIHHGLRDCDYMGQLKITGYKEDWFVVFRIEDNGCGISAEKREHLFEPNTHENFGIHSILHRLKIYFGDTITFEIEDLSPGTGITLKIPCRYD